MLTRLKKWGNSQGIRIPKNILEHTGIKVDEEVEMSAHEGKIVIQATHAVRGRYAIKDLIRNIPDALKLQEEHWGEPVGREVW